MSLGVNEDGLVRSRSGFEMHAAARELPVLQVNELILADWQLSSLLACSRTGFIVLRS